MSDLLYDAVLTVRGPVRSCSLHVAARGIEGFVAGKSRSYALFSTTVQRQRSGPRSQFQKDRGTRTNSLSWSGMITPHGQKA